MKRITLTLAAALALGLASCGKNESSTPSADEANKAAGSAADAAASTVEAAKAEAAKAADAAKAEAAKTADAAKAEAAKVADAAKAEAEKAADAVKAEAAKVEAARVAEAAKVEAAKAADNAKTQGLIDKAKSLIAESKFSDASGVLQQLTGLSLSSDQQKLVDGLKEQIQKALAARAASNAAGSVGDLLKK